MSYTMWADGALNEKWPGLAKVIEESSELATVAAKLICNNGDTRYWGNRNLEKELEDEIADTFAACNFLIMHNNLDQERMRARVDEKLAKYELWRTNHE